MTKTELIVILAEKAGVMKSDAEKVLAAFTDTVAETLKNGNSLTLIGFGTFEVSQRQARSGRNPQTGKEIKIAAAKVPKFRAGKALKGSVA